ncbi:hypothetical protein J4420_05025 [Candidatus Woesearchaeota archaeon]|nr:hypothetical protein [Candidatus Woesearchaeota archaeon]
MLMSIKERIAIIENDDKKIEWYVLHQLLELAMSVTGRGYVSDDYTKSIEFEIGDVTIFSDPYYGTVQIDETDVDSKTIQKLIKEVKRRLFQFDKKIETIREQAASEIFDKPIKDFEDF